MPKLLESYGMVGYKTSSSLDGVYTTCKTLSMNKKNNTYVNMVNIYG